MQKLIFNTLFILAGITSSAQTGYKDSISLFLKKYVNDHQVILGANKKFFRFFPVDEQYRVAARFTPAKDSSWFEIPTSSGKNKKYRKYGWLNFTINGQKQRLAVYQSQFLEQYNKYWDYLFLPFKDATNGKETYEGGRYLDLKTTDIKNSWIIIDFNKAYNPYCAYGSGTYSCPLPPKENHLNTAIKAGEEAFVK